MLAIPSYREAARAATKRTAFGAVKVTTASATFAFVLAGMAVPASAEQIQGKCSEAFGRVTCIYNDPTVTDYLLSIPSGVSELNIEAHGAAGGDGGSVNSKILAPEAARAAWSQRRSRFRPTRSCTFWWAGTEGTRTVRRPVRAVVTAAPTAAPARPAVEVAVALPASASSNPAPTPASSWPAAVAVPVEP
jgi:hypothetical protein